MRRVNAETITLIKRWEGLRLHAYLCPAGIWTIGYGHTGADVHAGLTITEQEADALLRRDLLRFEAGVHQAVQVPLTGGQFGALVSLAFNIGLAAFQRSTLLRRLNAGDYTGAQEQFHVWRRAAGEVLPGLVNRRAAEAALFGRGEHVTSQYIRPDPEPSPRAQAATEATGYTAATAGGVGAVLTEQAQQMAFIGGNSQTIRLVCTLLMLAGLALVVLAAVRRARQ